jgi:hypothetical protein
MMLSFRAKRDFTCPTDKAWPHWNIAAFCFAIVFTCSYASAKQLPHVSSLQATKIFRNVCAQEPLTVEAIVAYVASRIDAKFRPREFSKRDFPDRKFIFSRFESDGAAYVLQTVRLDNNPEFLECSIWVPIADLDRLVDQARTTFPARSSEGYLFMRENADAITVWDTDISKRSATLEVRLTIGNQFPSGFGMILARRKVEAL